MAATKKDIQTYLDELADVEGKIERNQAATAKRCAPAQKAFEEATADFVKDLATKNAPLEERRIALRKQIEAAVLEKRDKAGDPTLRQVESEKGYIAEATVSEKREVDPEKYFKAHAKKAGFWATLSVTIGKAEKLIGKVALDGLATKARSWKVDIRKA